MAEEQNKQEETELEKLKKERDEYLAGWQRAKADFINYKKDEVKRLEEYMKYASEELVEEFISVLDNFDLGIATLEKKGPIEKGVYMIRAQIEDIMKKRGLSKISVKPGSQFDPSFAEAITEVESDYPTGAVVEEIEPGYKLHDKIIRPVRVKVSKAKQN